MKTFTITTEPYGTFVAADGVVCAEKDNADRHGERLRALVDQANAARELFDSLDALFEHCAMVHKHWGDGDNSRQASAAIAAGQNLINKYRGIA